MSEPTTAALVIAERASGAVSPLTKELLGLARVLAEQQGGSVAACVLGKDVEAAARDLLRCGADRVYAVDAPILDAYQADAWLPDLLAIVAKVEPRAVIAGHTPIGADLAPRLAFRLGRTVVPACIGAGYRDAKLVLTRPCYGGKANEVVSAPDSPVVFTVKAKSFEAVTPRSEPDGRVIRVASTVEAAALRTRIRSSELRASEGASLESARAIVAGGGGMKGAQGFELAAELARLLGGAVGASRVACDLGWCPPSYQIGLSGKTVAPELYLAIGISGTGQHMAGCVNSRNIVAINSDRDAPIFRYARYGIVGDCHSIMPALIEQLASRRR